MPVLYLVNVLYADVEELRTNIGRRVSNDNDTNVQGSAEEVVALDETFDGNSVMDYARKENDVPERLQKSIPVRISSGAGKQRRGRPKGSGKNKKTTPIGTKVKKRGCITMSVMHRYAHGSKNALYSVPK